MNNLKMNIDIGYVKNICKCKVCKKKIYPHELRVNVIILEDIYWDNREYLRQVFFMHPECLVKDLTKKIQLMKTRQLNKEVSKYKRINKILGE